MKEASEIKPNYGPAYAAAMYPDLAKIFQSHGYALAVHGSLARDLDLIAVPWAPEVSPPAEVLAAATKKFSISVSECSPQAREHGRVAYTLIVGFGHCQIDLSFFPGAAGGPAKAAGELERQRRHAFKEWTKEPSGTPESYLLLGRSETFKEAINILGEADGRPGRFAAEGDTVEWSNCDRRGMRVFRGVVVGDSNRRNTHLRVRTDRGIREVHRSHARIVEAAAPTPDKP